LRCWAGTDHVPDAPVAAAEAEVDMPVAALDVQTQMTVI
jgi:hypothetical protein